MDLPAVKQNTLPEIRDVQEMVQLAEYFERCGMFGCSQQGQGLIILMTCLTEHISPLRFHEKYHLVQGQPTVRTRSALAQFHKLGGKHKIVRRDGNCAAIHLEWNGISQTFTFTWEEAAKDCDFPYSKKTDANGNRILKDSWKSPRGRMQMLWVRVVSDALSAVCPQALEFYSAEETSDYMPGVTDADMPDEPMVVYEDAEAEQVVAEQGGPEKDHGYGTLPVGQNVGKPWAALSIAQLEAVLDSDMPEITEEHKVWARIALNEKREKESV